MLCKVDDIAGAVRTILEDNSSERYLNELDDTDAVLLDEVIRSKITESVRTVLLTAPLSMIGTGKAFGKTIHWYQHEGHGAGYVLLPKDFLRLVTFQMSDWTQEAHIPISPMSAEYKQQRSRFGVRGCPQRPVVALINLPQGMALEFFSCEGGKGTHVSQSEYIPYPRIIKRKVYIPKLLQKAVINHAAYLTAVTTKRTELAERLLQNNKTILNDNLI